MRYRMLTRNNEFSRAYARGASFVHPCLVLYVNKNRCGRMRLGLTATKKVGNAVQRNRARRVMREAVAAVLPPEFFAARGKGKDLVLVARGVTPRKKSHEIAAVLAKLCKQAGIVCRAGSNSAVLPGQAAIAAPAQATATVPPPTQPPQGQAAPTVPPTQPPQGQAALTVPPTQPPQGQVVPTVQPPQGQAAPTAVIAALAKEPTTQATAPTAQQLPLIKNTPSQP